MMLTRLPLLLVAAVCAAAPAVAAEPFIAGLHPDRRPDGAPQLTENELNAEQLARAMRGVSQPWPGNTESVGRTGHWWVPFRHAGMPAPYDIRRLHAETQSGDVDATAPTR